MLNKLFPILTVLALAPFAAAQDTAVPEVTEATLAPASESAGLVAAIPAEKTLEYYKVFGALISANIGLGNVGLTDAEINAFATGLAEGLKNPDAAKTYRDFIKENEVEFQMFIGSLQERVQAKMMEEQTAAMEKEIAQNQAAGQAYIEKCLKDPGFKKLPGGTLIKVISAGDLAVPIKATSMLSARYTGTFVDGTIFDSSDRNPETGEPLHFSPDGEVTEFPCALEMLIPGWIEALTTVGKGAKLTLVIPPEQAYGNEGPLPPASTLVFDIEIVDVKEAPAEAEASEDGDVPADDEGK
ncbi:MAG: FKBP-type peptidyl-prolyl cis-trans isomerase [Opitutales bacterium]|nr:FKBP-type peptidyl-prolyl cis-trans isomerase [Opitutales bacterium]